MFGWRVREHPPAAPRGDRELIAVIAVTPETLNVPKSLILWSGRRDSNPRQPAWKAGTLPTELLPLGGLHRPQAMAVRADDIALCDLGQDCVGRCSPDHATDRIALERRLLVIEVHRACFEASGTIRARNRADSGQ